MLISPLVCCRCLPDGSAVIPGATHTGVLANVDLLTSMIVSFLDAPIPE